MFNSVVLDVVIGLFFIYLLYSLLVTVVSELIATLLHLRARNLKEAIDRMLNDETNLSPWKRFVDTLKLMKNPKKNPVVNAFYNHPEIKYLGSSSVFKLPSSFKASSFAKTVMRLIADNDPVTRATFDVKLNSNITIAGKTKKGEDVKTKLDPDTSIFIKDLWQESQEDMEKFKLLLEDWFERTMEHTIEWYKRKIKVITFVLGFFLAWFFNADTFVIVHNLSTDKAAREQIVSMANAYVQNNPTISDSEKLDSLLAVKGQLQKDIVKANYILGSGGWPPDTVFVKIDPETKARIYTPPIDSYSSSFKYNDISDNKLWFSFGDKIYYMLRLLCHNFWGFLITAIAISLGAPFWFDLLNKIMKLKTSQQEPVKNPKAPAPSDNISPLNRVG